MSNSNQISPHKEDRLRPRLVSTPAYQSEVLRLMIEEANRVARELNLPEELPVTRSNLVHVYIGRPTQFVRGMVGNIETTNYIYYLTSGRTLSGIDQQHPEKTFYEARVKYTWPINRLDTNAALEVATQIMTSTGMDAAAMNQDCKVSVMASMTEGPHGKHFVPDYWVDWQKPGTNIAHLEFLEPTRSIRSLQVYDAKYILRKPIEIPNLAELLEPDNSREAVLREWELATNALKLREFLIQNHAPESVLREMGLNQTNGSPETNAPVKP